jgi:lysophospholipase L1-like esterase
VSKRLVGPVVLVVALLLSFGVAELGLRVLSRYRLYVFDVEMWQYARQIKLVSTHPGVVEEHRPLASAVLMGVPVRTDAQGFRLPSPTEEARRRPDDRNVIALGDSVTFGWGVGEADTFPAQLETILNQQCPHPGGAGVTVHNAGIGNCNTSMEVERYKVQLRQLHPDWVILGYSYNDAEPDPVPSTNPFLWHSSLLALASARLDRHSGKLRDYASYYIGLYQDGLPGWEQCKRKLHELGAILAADGVPATIILLPELHEPWHFGRLAGAFAQVAAISRQSGFEVIDPSGDFPQAKPESFWVTGEDAHPNGPVQAIYARDLARSRYACGGRLQHPTTAAGGPAEGRPGAASGQ